MTERIKTDSRGRPSLMVQALNETHHERLRQDGKWGLQQWPDGTGEWNREYSDQVRDTTDWRGEHGLLTWKDILEEEVWEAFAESDPEKLKTELIQVAAVALSWWECIERGTR